MATAQRVPSIEGSSAKPEKGRVRATNEALLLRAAEEVFARVGFAGATLEEIAGRANLPKANLIYYFKSKQGLYRAVLDNILDLWLAQTDLFTEDGEPRAAIEHYVRAKMDFSRRFPGASKVFASEILAGAPEISDFLNQELRALVVEKSRVLRQWMNAGHLSPFDPKQFFYMVWATTQTHADFEAQIRAVEGQERLSEQYFSDATEETVGFILRACGLQHPADERLLPGSRS
jgi:TetR/AcrR family transcriptional regulator